MRSSSVTRISQAMLVVVLVAVGSLAWTVSALAASTAPPMIESESVSHITENHATLNARIDPNGLETTYRFRLESGCLPPLACLAITTYPLPSAEIPASYEINQVSLDLNNAGVTLQPATKYRYSVEATNSDGTTEGPDQTFTTPPGTQEPLIESESVSHITPTDATLEAQINTEGFETTYEFHLLRRWACEEVNPPCYPPIYFLQLPSGKLLGSFVGQSVSLDLNSAGVSLWPGGKYEYWVTATSSAGTTTGAIQTFTTPSSSPPSIDGESATSVTEHDGTLEAKINPNSAYTAYEFQIAASSNYNYPHMACPLSLPGYAQCDVISGEEPLPPGLVREPEQGSIPAGLGEEAVRLDLASIGASLQPATTYHYRVIAANTSNGATVNGPDQTFTTTSSGVAPQRDQSKGFDGEPPALQSMPSASPADHKNRKHRRHRHRLHRAKRSS